MLPIWTVGLWRVIRPAVAAAPVIDRVAWTSVRLGPEGGLKSPKVYWMFSPASM